MSIQFSVISFGWLFNSMDTLLQSQRIEKKYSHGNNYVKSLQQRVNVNSVADWKKFMRFLSSVFCCCFFVEYINFENIFLIIKSNNKLQVVNTYFIIRVNILILEKMFIYYFLEFLTNFTSIFFIKNILSRIAHTKWILNWCPICRTYYLLCFTPSPKFGTDN